MRLLHVSQHVGAAPGGRFHRQDRRGRRLRIEHRGVIAQKPVRVRLAERLARHAGDAPDVRHDELAQGLGGELARRARHHSTAVEHESQAPISRAAFTSGAEP